MPGMNVKPARLREAANVLGSRNPRNNPARGVAAMATGDAPSIASDLNANLSWWAGRIGELTTAADEAEASLRANADCYDSVDSDVAQTLTRLATGLERAPWQAR